MLKKLFFIASILFLPLSTQAARLYFQPEHVTATPGQTVEIGVYLDPQGDQINALEGQLTWPDRGLELTEIRVTNSLVNLWVQAPALVSGEDGGETINFSGVIPGGFSGFLSPFYHGVRPGKIFSLIAKDDATGDHRFTLNWLRASALLNDGEGTATTTWTANLDLHFAAGLGNSAPLSAVPVDYDLPEPFTPEVGRDASLFGGRSFVAFTTTDSGSGIAHYEVAEHSTPSPANDDWLEAVSPYKLRDQSLSSYVSVRAWDRGGNARVETIPPTHTPSTYGDTYLYLIMLVLCGAALYVYHYYSSRSSRRR